MTDHQREAPGRPEHERYYAQYAALDAGPEISTEVALHEAINEGTRQGWELISVARDPTSEGVFLVWDTGVFLRLAR